MSCSAFAAENGREAVQISPPALPLRPAPAQARPRSVSAEKWSQMAAELLRVEGLRNPALALECATKALEINPAYAPAYLNRGSARMMLDQPREAVADYDQAVRLAPGLSQAWFNRALAHEALAEWQEAIRDFTFVIDSDPREAEALARRASIFFELLQDARACEDLQKACQLGLCSPLEQARSNRLCPENNH